MTWATPQTILISAKRQVDFKTVESFREVRVNMIRIPSGQDIEMKPSGQRSWNQEMVYAESSLELKIDDIIYFEEDLSQKFRVVSKSDWSKFGFVEYSLISDYQKTV